MAFIPRVISFTMVTKRIANESQLKIWYPDFICCKHRLSSSFDAFVFSSLPVPQAALRLSDFRALLSSIRFLSLQAAHQKLSFQQRHYLHLAHHNATTTSPEWLTFCTPDFAWRDFNELIFCHVTCRRAVHQQAEVAPCLFIQKWRVQQASM